LFTCPGLRYADKNSLSGSLSATRRRRERNWTDPAGQSDFIFDNLIASGNAKPMIVVMANGYATRAGYAVPDLTGKPFGSPEFVQVMQERTGAFEDDVTLALIPFPVRG
jgi:hypothetical protein